jgi:hypothetical protein
MFVVYFEVYGLRFIVVLFKTIDIIQSSRIFRFLRLTIMASAKLWV